MSRPQATYEFENSQRTFEEIVALCPLVKTKPMLRYQLKMGRRTVSAIVAADPAMSRLHGGRSGATRYCGYTHSHRHLKAADELRKSVPLSPWGAEAKRKYDHKLSGPGR
jgi:hypothetical protein